MSNNATEIHVRERTKDITGQLSMARFAMHKVRTKIYALAVLRGEMTEAQADEAYTMAMDNFDQLMEQAVDGSGRYEGCEADMAKGFVMPEVGK